MPETTGELKLTWNEHAASAIAGALAEASITLLTLSTPDLPPQPLTTRTTNLPQVLLDTVRSLAQGRSASLTAAEHDTTLILGPTRLKWSTASPELAAQFTRLTADIKQ